MLATEISAQQVFARIAFESGLLTDPSRKRKNLSSLISALGGLRGDRLDTAHLALAARFPDYKPESLLRALQERQSLVRTWGVRGALQILPTAQLGEYLAAGALTASRWRRFLDARSSLATPARLRLLKRLCPDTVSREALRDAIPDATTRLFMLREAAQAGQIVWKEGDGGQLGFAWTLDWLGREVETQYDLNPLVGRYLTTFGPVGAADLAGWLGVTVAAARQLMAKHRVEEVHVEGEDTPTFMKPEDLEALQQTRKSMARGFVAIPPGDPLLIAYKTRYHQGEGNDGSEDDGVVFLDGRMVATWKIEQEKVYVRELNGEHHIKSKKLVMELVERAGLTAVLGDLPA